MPPNEESAIQLPQASPRQVGLGGTAVEVVVIDSDHDAEARKFLGSRSFLVDGVDLFPAAPSGLSCRVYGSSEGRLRGLPNPQSLIDRLHRVIEDG